MIEVRWLLVIALLGGACSKDEASSKAADQAKSAPGNTAPKPPASEEPKEPSVDELFARAETLSRSISPGDDEVAQALFDQILKEYPDHPRADDVRRILKADEQSDLYFDTGPFKVIDKGNKEGLPPLIDKLKAHVKEFPDGGYTERLQNRILVYENLLASWPEIIVSSVDTLMLRYGDLRGKEVAVWGESYPEWIRVKADSYYNCKFKSQSKWRGFTVDSSRGPFHIYCRKGKEACEQLFEATVDRPRMIIDVRLKYPRRNEVCEENQAELLSYVQPRIWTSEDMSVKSW